MCGITGIWNLDNSPLNPRMMDLFTDLLAHRGPDGRGIFYDPDLPLSLGHRRLSIIDLSDSGKQPMFSRCGRYCIVYNGEIYNHIEIRKKLEELGYIFVSRSDTEVILNAYDAWGEKCLFEFNGMWAFALWDLKKKRLFISRDRFGVKPLYYSFDGKHFSFASEVKAFLALNFVPFIFNSEMVALAISQYWMVEAVDNSLIEGIKKIPAGHNLSLEYGKEPHIYRWWNTLENLTDVPYRYSDQVNKFKELFFDACRLRMRSDVPIATCLSGGLDSSSVICVMKELAIQCESVNMGEWQNAFIANYPGVDFDETVYAEEVTNHAKIPPVIKVITPDSLLKNLDEILYFYEDISDVHIGPWELYKNQKEKGIKVSIDGHGGDELLAGYPQYFFSVVHTLAHDIPIMHMRKIERYKRVLYGLYPDPSQIMEPWDKKSLYLEPFLDLFKLNPKKLYWDTILPLYNKIISMEVMNKKSLENHFDQHYVQLDPYFRMKLNLDINIKYLNTNKNLDLLKKMLLDDFHFFLLPTNLRDFDRLSMAHGVEVRSPFLDWRLVTYCFSLNEDSLVGNGFSKMILRDSLKGILPESVRSRKIKGGFANPLNKWLFNEMSDYLFSVVNDASFEKSDIWDGKLLQRQLDTAYSEGNYPVVHKIWLFVLSYKLMEIYSRKKIEFNRYCD